MTFQLKKPIAPPVLVLPPPHRDAMTGALSDAMKCLLSGDHERLEQLELEYLNVLVRIGEFGVRYPDGEPYEFFDRPQRVGEYEDECKPFILRILRGVGPRGESQLVWTLAEPCRRCIGKLRHVPCRVCNGRWFVGDEFEWMVYTDIEGILVREDLD